MLHEIYVFGDSHWRVFFPFLNEDNPGICFEKNGIVFLDSTANELSGATIWGLQNENSRHQARNRILQTIDVFGSIENIALVFGEVDARFHWQKYLNEDESFNAGKVLELADRYLSFIVDDLIKPGRVTKNVFVYFGFRYPNGEETEVNPHTVLGTAFYVVRKIVDTLEQVLPLTLQYEDKIHVIIPADEEINACVGSDGVHLVPQKSFDVIFPFIESILNDQNKS